MSPPSRPVAPRRPRRLVLVAAAAAALAVSVVGGRVASAQTTEAEAAATLALVPHAGELVRRGAVLYDHNCSACHGDTGGGMAEALAGFPHDERRCSTCHKPSNPPQMDHLAMNWRNAFDIGVAPPLIGEEARLSVFATGEGLFGYLRATMPRPWPGSLSDDAYLAITAFLARANGAVVPERLDAPEDLAEVSLRGPE